MATDSRFDAIPLDESKGQVWTPDSVGKLMVDLVAGHFNHAISILDPASGPGTFMTLVDESEMKVANFTAVEIDPLLHSIASTSIGECRFPISLINADFLSEDLSLPTFDAVIVNPPYIRHEKLRPELKQFLTTQFSEVAQQKLSQRTNLYGYFLLKALKLLKPDGVMCAIIYDSLHTTHYGKLLEDALSRVGEFVSRKRVDSPFHNRLIDAEILVIKKRVETKLESVPQANAERDVPRGYCSLKELARVARGTTFARRSCYVFSRPDDNLSLTPLITKQRPNGSLSAVSNSYAILKTGIKEVDSELMNEVRSRTQQVEDNTRIQLPAAVTGGILFNYYLRGNVRHLINESRIPASDNFYCVEPLDPRNLRIHWFLANSNQYLRHLMKASRPQGSGLRKLQLYEYCSVPFPDYRSFSSNDFISISHEASTAIQADWSIDQVRERSSEMLGNVFSDYV